MTIVFVHGVPETAAVWRNWGPMKRTTAPGLTVHPSDDPFSIEPLAKDVAEQLGAGFKVIEGTNHFWPYQNPEGGAALLREFWSTLD